MKKLLVSLFALVLILSLAIASVVVLSVSKQASISAPRSVSPQQVADAKQWLQSNVVQFSKAQQAIDIQLSQQQMQGLLALASKAFSGLNAEAHFAPEYLQLQASVALPKGIYHGYINSHITLLSSAEGLRFGDWQIGGLRLPGSIAKTLLIRGLEALFPELQFEELLAGLSQVDIDAQQVSVKVKPVADLGVRVASVYKNVSQWQNPSVSKLPVDVYYQKLLTLSQQYGQQQTISLYDYLYPLSFDVAMRGEQGELLTEQQALVWAMAMFFSQGPFQQVMAQRFEQQISLQAAPTNVTLAGRRDLLLHFVYSAGLSMAGEQGFSASIGEFKELFDSLEGGSGFSFADLAADKAGIVFAETAKQKSKAKQFLTVMRNARSEEAFFPRIDDLTEGISEPDFAHIYGSTDSELYQQKVFFIDQRIANLPAFKD
ncbi:hypothetical protein [Agarivorans sp. DSG3-1]|uniref:hypothetical protein n=1 Tax=Agarivorans sp. DSG3-1 TaxID=3342249 RepID=UPI00398E3DC7